MATEMQTVTVVIFEQDACRLALLDEDAAMALIAVASEDPVCWDDIVATQEWTSLDANENDRSQYEFTKQVHRDWLMTPRP